MNRLLKSYRTLFVGSLLTTLLLTYPFGWTTSAIAHTQSAHAEQIASVPVTTPLFENLGNYSHPISIRNPQAQRYFDQGLILFYGFNHAERQNKLEARRIKIQLTGLQSLSIALFCPKLSTLGECKLKSIAYLELMYTLIAIELQNLSLFYRDCGKMLVGDRR